MAKKYPRFKKDFETLINTLEKNPTQGISLGKDTYKVRIKITDKNKGKSGGARVITYVILALEEIVILAIYDKSEEESITDSEIIGLKQDYLQNKNR